MCWLSRLFGTSGIERPSPSDWITEDGIKEWVIYLPWDKLNVKFTQLPKIWMPAIPDTNSMDGAFDVGNNNILIAGSNESDQKNLIDYLSVGDVAVYESDGAYPLIIHRIVRIDTDNQGKYFKFKGDNNAVEDTGKVRESQIKWISIGVIY